MPDLRLWRRECIAELLKLYKSHPCLWKVSSDEYKNRVLKDAAYRELVDYCKSNGLPDANRDFITKKIQCLRGCFRKEVKRIEIEKDRKPTLWYFDLLLFTKDQEISDINSKADELNDPLQSSIKEEAADSENSVYLEEDRDHEEECSDSDQNEYKPPSPKRKRQRSSQIVAEAPKNIPESIEYHSNNFTEFEAVGINTARKLAKMDPLQAIYAESLINNVLSKGLLRKLSEDSGYCDKCNTRN